MEQRAADEKVLGGLTHILVLFGWLGLVLNMGLLVLYYQKSPFVAGHAKQALALRLVVWGLSAVLGTFFGVSWGFGVVRYNVGLALVGLMVSAALAVALLVLVVFAAIKAFRGETYRYPVFGEWVKGFGPW